MRPVAVSCSPTPTSNGSLSCSIPWAVTWAASTRSVGTVTFAYDSVGDRILKDDPRGNRLTSLYDPLRRLTTQEYSSGKRNSYAYDPAGNRTRLADSSGVYTTTYDAKNRTTATRSPGGKRLTYAYDTLDRRTRLIDADGGRFSYAYDAQNRLTILTNPQSKRSTLGYDALDRLTAQQHGNGSRTSQVFDPAGQLTSLSNLTGASTVVNRFTYGYDPVARRSSVREANGDRTTFAYDPSGQLTRERKSGAVAYDVTYTYDGAGNRRTQIDTGTRTTYVFDGANQLLTETTSTAHTSYTYDNSGNRTQKNAPAALTDYSWDEDSRLSAVLPISNPVTLTYNAEGRRVQKVTPTQTTQFLYDFDKVLQEADGSGSTTHEYTSTVEQYGNLLSAYDGTNTGFYTGDALGSTDALLNDSQAATDRYRYRAFGLDDHYQGSSNNVFTFVGKQGYVRDLETDLYFVRARYYDYAAARWLSEDPLGYKAGDANLYRYCKNDPVNYTDPSGLQQGVPDWLVTAVNGALWFANVPSTDFWEVVDQVQDIPRLARTCGIAVRGSSVTCSAASWTAPWASACACSTTCWPGCSNGCSPA